MPFILKQLTFLLLSNKLGPYADFFESENFDAEDYFDPPELFAI